MPNAAERMLTWEDLLCLRHNGELPGHAEMEGKTLFFKFNTGPSGTARRPRSGEAVALKHAGAGDVKVFAVEGEGGHTAGCHHEVKNSAYGLGLDNLIYLFDWNDHGIDSFANSEVVHGTPEEWFEPYGWRVAGAEDGHDFAQITSALLEIVHAEDTEGRPGCVWFKTRKGRGYDNFDAASHGAAHKRNSELFWECREDFASKYGVTFEGHGDTTDPGEDGCREQSRGWFETVFSVLRDTTGSSSTWPTPCSSSGSPSRRSPRAAPGPRQEHGTRTAAGCADQLPEELFVAAGPRPPNRDGFAKFGAWVNASRKERMGRPLVLACSADLADSTAISGFAKDFGDKKGFGWYERNSNTEGSLLPQQITEFTNAGLVVGAATVNMSRDPRGRVRGLLGRLLDLRLVLVPQVRDDAALQPARPGLRAEGRQGHLGRRPLRPRDGRGQPHPLRHLRAGGDAALPRGPRDQPAPLGAQRGRARPRGRALDATSPSSPCTSRARRSSIPDRKALGVPSHMEAAKGAYVSATTTRAAPRRARSSSRARAPRTRSTSSCRASTTASAPNVQDRAGRLATSSSGCSPRSTATRSCTSRTGSTRTVISNGSRIGMHDWLSTKVAERVRHDSRLRRPLAHRRHRSPRSRPRPRSTPRASWRASQRFAGDREERLGRLHYV